MTDNPYSAPKAEIGQRESLAWASTFFPPFLSSIVVIPIGFVLIGLLTRQPEFMLKPGFLLTLGASSAASAIILLPYRSASWILRAVLAPPLSFCLLLLTIFCLRLVAT